MAITVKHQKWSYDTSINSTTISINKPTNVKDDYLKWLKSLGDRHLQQRRLITQVINNRQNDKVILMIKENIQHIKIYI